MGEIFSPPLTSLLNTHMNYLILTPDGVGSTILQRLVTMTLYLEGQTVTNTHELTNGIGLKDGIASKTSGRDYSQTLGEIEKILAGSEANTTLISRLAKYHIDRRKDSKEDCTQFFNFLNNHFDIKIACIRENLFEYAMSWSIRNKSGVLNVYNRQDRMKVKKVSEVDEDFFLQKCIEYVNYVEWIEQNFPKVQKVSYEDMVKDSDKTMEAITGYKDTFNKKLGLPLQNLLSREHEYLQQQDSQFSKDYMRTLIKYKMLCVEMMQKNIIMNVPLKNTTLTDKKMMIKNFDRCLEKFYKFAKNHNWIDQSKATYDFWSETHIC